MKVFVTALVFLSVVSAEKSLACAACSPNASKQIRNNIQSAPGAMSGNSATVQLAKGAPMGGEKAFKNEKVFESVGKDQNDTDPNWNSSIGQ